LAEGIMNATRSIRAACAAAVLIFVPAGAALANELTITPAAPRYMEPVFLRIKQTPFPTFLVLGATVTMTGNNLDVRLDGTSEIGATSDDVMLGRFPAGTYTVTLDGSPAGSFSVAPPARTGPASFVPPVNYSDLWWDPSQPGWGMSINQGPTNDVFAVWFTYDAAGKPVWYTLQPGRWENTTTYSGTIYSTTGSPFTTTFDPNALGVQKVGNGFLHFDTASAGDFTYTINGVSGKKSLQRQPIE
jgi:hypothetical protein